MKWKNTLSKLGLSLKQCTGGEGDLLRLQIRFPRSVEADWTYCW